MRFDVIRASWQRARAGGHARSILAECETRHPVVKQCEHPDFCQILSSLTQWVTKGFPCDRLVEVKVSPGTSIIAASMRTCITGGVAPGVG